MTPAGGFPYDLAGLAILLLLNRTVVPSLQHAGAFWTFVAIDVAAAAYFAVVGVQGLHGFPVVNWIVAGLLCFHAVQNVLLRGTRRRKP